MYLPAHFAETDRAAIELLIAKNEFATLITATADETWVTHLPLLHTPEADGWGELIGHMALGNAHWRAFDGGRTVAIFHGPHAYVSPRWYERAPANVPTWNYAVVHAHGQPTLVQEPDAVVSELRRLVASEESAWPDPWSFDDSTETAAGLRKGIVFFRLPIERIEAKFKLSQNRKPADREQVIDGLAQSGRPSDVATAELMRQVGRAAT